MLPKDLNKIAALIKDKPAYDAFLFILDDEQSKVINRLSGKPTEYELVRIAGQYDLIQNLRKARENGLALEKESNAK